MQNLAFQHRNLKWSVALIIRDVKNFTVKLICLGIFMLLVSKLLELEYQAVFAAMFIGLVIFTFAAIGERLWVTGVRIDKGILYFDHSRLEPINVHDVKLSRVEEVEGGLVVHIRYKIKKKKTWGCQLHLDQYSQEWEVLSSAPRIKEAS